MTLLPCEQCHRHFAADASACPFCAAARPPSAPTAAQTVGRFSRAAVFAGLASCYVNNPPPQQPPPPPPPDQQQQQQQQHFAEPPAGTAMIRGTVMRTDGAPGANIRVVLENPGTKAIATTTDMQGHYTFSNLAAGTYRVSFNVQYDPRRERLPQREVSVADGASAQVDMSIAPPPPPDYSNIPKPYGAPPARRRLV